MYFVETFLVQHFYYFYFSNASEPFQINLTASCNFGCECDMNDVQPVCGANGLTYFSPCHAGCTNIGTNSDNFTNCACEYFCNSCYEEMLNDWKKKMNLKIYFYSRCTEYHATSQ